MLRSVPVAERRRLFKRNKQLVGNSNHPTKLKKSFKNRCMFEYYILKVKKDD